MNNLITRITASAAAVLLILAPAAAYADSVTRNTPSEVFRSSHERKELSQHPRDNRGFRAGGHFIINASAELLEMDRKELIASLRSGKTLYALALEKKGWNEDQFIQKLSERASLKLEDSVKDGRLTSEEAGKLKAGLPALLKLSISHAGGMHTGKPGAQPPQTP